MSFSLPSTRLRPSLRGANTSLYQESRRSAVRTIPAEVLVRAKAFNDESLQSTSVQSTSASRQIVAQQSKGPSPIVMERFQGVASQLMNQRIIRLGGAVDDDSCNLIVAQLLWLDATDPKKDITLYVNSPGGSVTAGMAVFDTMRHVRPDISTVCVGLAASMGNFFSSSPDARVSFRSFRPISTMDVPFTSVHSCLPLANRERGSAFQIVES